MAVGSYKLAWEDGSEVYLNLAQVVTVQKSANGVWSVYTTAVESGGDAERWGVTEQSAREIISRL